MKIATFNINGIHRRLGNLTAWLAEAEPDVVCLQEIKSTDAAFPHAVLEDVGYGAICHGQGPHHGVAILRRDGAPIETRRGLPGDRADREARYIDRYAGLRIDHLLVSGSLIDRLADAGVDRDVRGKPGASDHAPAWITIG